MAESEDLDEMMLFPITDIDGCGDVSPSHSHDADDEGDQAPKKRVKNYVSLKQRRHSKLVGIPIPLVNLNIQNKLHQEVIGSSPEDPRPRLGSAGSQMKWKLAMRKLKTMKDPWAKYGITKFPTEKARRHRYSALKKEWVIDDVEVKMDNKPFNRGAMRECFRLKKLGPKQTGDWEKALNYVAKSYMEDVERDVYFEDVKLQNDAKLWGEEYNRHNPPKKVDIFQMCVLEFTEREDKPLFHLEHFIEGEYIKYNSNSGFVDENLRLTPQAFSHFTFERSDHKLIIVDIQGVGDLWTDPQIHTEQGTEYGDGNLGTKGMALFFHSHICNKICESLNLSKFDLAPSEIKGQTKFVRSMSNSATIFESKVVSSCSPLEREDLSSYLSRSRTSSYCDSISEDTSNAQSSPQNSPTSPSSGISVGRDEEDMELDSSEPHYPDGRGAPFQRSRRIRYVSESLDSTGPSSCEEELSNFRAAMAKHRPSCVAGEINHRLLENLRRCGNTVLGSIHHDLAKYHELGRFVVDNEEVDKAAAIYHEEQAANLGMMEAVLNMAKYYLEMTRDVLHSWSVEPDEENLNKGVDFMERAADAGDRSAMIYMAKAYETGAGLGTERSKDHSEAVRFYEDAIHQQAEDACGEFDATIDDPDYLLKAKVAELLLAGEYGLEKDAEKAAELYTEAAESAMEAMKGRLANRYYALSEEAWAQVEE